MQYREYVNLAPFTTLQVGGPARWFAEATNETEVLEAARFAREQNLPLLVLGGGSNLLVADEGFPGLVLRIAVTGIEEAECAAGSKSEGAEHARDFSVAAGENWDAFVSLAVAKGCGGVECLAGIPGTVGGTPVQNVGAYGQEVSSVILSVRALDLSTMAFVELPNADCGFAYRQSIFNSVRRGRFILTRVIFRMQLADRPQLSYIDLKLYFKGKPTPKLAEVAAGVRQIRHAKGMLLVAGEQDCRSAGSFFKNPVLTVAQVAHLAAATQAVQPPGAGLTPSTSVPQFPAGPGLVKVPAAWLLERAGFHKGFQLGRAGISSRHTLALINRGGASAREILELKELIVREVWGQFGVRLEAEPVMVGPGLTSNSSAELSSGPNPRLGSDIRRA